jgi:O-acetylhomoserine (thiol)-lyase
MTGPKYPGFDTLALHAGQSPDPATGSRAVPIYQTTSYVFRDTAHAASLFNMERAGHVYSRISNPTVAVLEERIAALEGGVGAIATASGQAALHLAIATLMDAGCHIVASSSLYGGSHNLLGYTLKRFGIDTTFVRPGDLDAWKRSIRPGTRLLFGETLGNPGLDVLDIPAVAAIAQDAAVPLLVDATFTTPYLMKPFALGAHLLYHSATKFLGGHGTAIGGVLVDSGRFDWGKSGKFAQLSEPYAGFHGMDFEDESGTPRVPPARTQGRVAGFRRLHGANDRVPDPAGRGDVAPAHAAARREYAQGRAVPRRPRDGRNRPVSELPGHPDHELCKRLLPRGAGAVFSFNLKGGREAGRAFIEALRVFSHLANVGRCQVAR